MAGLWTIPADGSDLALTAGGARRLGRARRRADQTNSAQQLHRLETLPIVRCPWRIFDDAPAVAVRTEAVAVHAGSAAETDCSCLYSRDSNQGWRRFRKVTLRVVTVAGRTATTANASAISASRPALSMLTPCAN